MAARYGPKTSSFWTLGQAGQVIEGGERLVAVLGEHVGGVRQGDEEPVEVPGAVRQAGAGPVEAVDDPHDVAGLVREDRRDGGQVVDEGAEVGAPAAEGRGAGVDEHGEVVDHHAGEHPRRLLGDELELRSLSGHVEDVSVAQRARPAPPPSQAGAAR
jgi:hypothetical protein